LEELYAGKLGVFKSEEGHSRGSLVMSNGLHRGQRAWLQMGREVTICSRKMKTTHILQVYVEWSNLDGKKDAVRHYTAPAGERELESLRLE
jgi:hypothetical protein